LGRLDWRGKSLTFFIHLPMKMEPIRSSETSAVKTQTPGNYPKRNILQLKHGENLKTSKKCCLRFPFWFHNSIVIHASVALRLGREYLLYM